MTSTLEDILEYKKQELESVRRKVSLKDVQSKARDAQEPKAFLENFKKGKVNIIAEVKKASPSAGIIREDFKPLDVAHIYADHGAAALSVLTDEYFFKGHLKNLINIKAKVNLPCLRKDFTLSEYHIFEARGADADAVLLIVAALDDHQLADYYQMIKELKMTPLVEVHNEEELDRAIELGIIGLVGVNNRNLKTFVTDIDVSSRLSSKMKSSSKKISESGIKTHADIELLISKGYDGFLVGESLMKKKDIGAALSELINGRES